MHSVLISLTANTSTHDHMFYRDTFIKQLRAWGIPLVQVIGVTTDGDAAVVKVGHWLYEIIWCSIGQVFKKGISELGDLYWQRCAAHLTSNLLKGAVVAVHSVARVLAAIDSIIFYHRATPHRRAILAECARRAPCTNLMLIRVCSG